MVNDLPSGVRDSTIERTVARIWKDVLNMPENGITATFFELGGQSISAVRIAARIEDELGIDVNLDDLFEDPDLETFVRAVAARAHRCPNVARKP